MNWTVLSGILSGFLLTIGSTYGAPDPHDALFNAEQYPSAKQCAQCHGQIFEEWRSSAHAYASISPMFHKFEQTINDLSQGTIGSFCMRCHATVGTTMGEERHIPLWERSQVSREGITCITCHRINEAYSKVNGERRVVPGDIHAAVYGGIGGDGIKKIIEQKDEFRVAPTKEEAARGMAIHSEGKYFSQLNKSEFCVSCHQVAVNAGIKLEVVWDQYRASPAFKEGTSCQDCHMSTSPGKPTGFSKGPVAVVNGKSINSERTHYDHSFVGPGYPITHPGIFPHNLQADKLDKTMQEWLEFDWRAGWGTDDFEERVEDGKEKVTFPASWEDVDDRFDAREVIDNNLAKLEEKRTLRKALMENGSHIDGPFFASPPKAGETLKFHVKITNKNNGHNLPSGSLGAQPELWLNVAVIDPDGKNIWESGYLDRNGDFCDLHSLSVREGLMPRDKQLFNLQTKFLTTNVKGTEREMYLPVNMDVDQLPFLRPAAVPTTVLNHQPFVRMEARSLPPLASRNANYSVPAKVMEKAGTYKIAVRMRSRAEPIYFMRFVGATEEMERGMNEWMLDAHPYTVEFEVKK
ncbi:MAG: nitrate/TMAO reductase-like tetraheme cytochrome c subunit [Kiritimatiellia bacterium]|jgi:nitrate/TMAO reductase-like tetraheme cytochrome c subunit